MNKLTEITDPELLTAPEVPNNYFLRLIAPLMNKIKEIRLSKKP